MYKVTLPEELMKMMSRVSY